MQSTGVGGGRKIVLHGVEVYTIDDQGRIAKIRSWFRAPEGIELDPYFRPLDETR